MKSNELFEEIHSGNIKDGTKINVVNENTEEYITTIEYKNGKLNWTSGEFDTSYLCDINIEFLVEGNKTIKELEISKSDRKMYTDYINNIADKLNEVINQINKEREEK